MRRPPPAGARGERRPPGSLRGGSSPRGARLVGLLACAWGLSAACAEDSAPLTDGGAPIPPIADASAAVDAGSPELGPNGASVDAGTGDVSLADTGSGDASLADGGSGDGGPADLGPPDAADVGEADAGHADAGGPSDAGSGAPDAGATCRYVLLDSQIVECASGYAYARTFRASPPSRRCPDEVRLGGNAYADLPSALRGESCNPDCVWSASRSVSFVDHCGRRNGYIIFRAQDPRQCDDLYEFSSGLFPSVAAWEAATPC